MALLVIDQNVVLELRRLVASMMVIEATGLVRKALPTVLHRDERITLSCTVQCTVTSLVLLPC